MVGMRGREANAGWGRRWQAGFISRPGGVVILWCRELHRRAVGGERGTEISRDGKQLSLNVPAAQAPWRFPEVASLEGQPVASKVFVFFVGFYCVIHCT